MRNIEIKTTSKTFYRQFLELLHSIPPFNKLRPRELDVLSEIMYQNNKYKTIEIESRILIVFSTKVRKEMRNTLGVSEEIFNNNLSTLRKHKILNSGNRLATFLEKLLFNKEFTLQFNFISNDSEI